MSKIKHNSNTISVRHQWSIKKSVLLVTAAALASSIGISHVAKAEGTCPDWSNDQILANRYSTDYAFMTVDRMLMGASKRTCATPVLHIGHRGVHSYGMDLDANKSAVSVFPDHSSKVSVTPVGQTRKYLVDENTYMSFLIATYRAVDGDIIAINGQNFRVNVPWTDENDAVNAMEVDVQRDRVGNFVALHDSTLGREIGMEWDGYTASELDLNNTFRVYFPANHTRKRLSVIRWDPDTDPYVDNLYKVPLSELATWAQIRGGSKIFIQYHVRSIDDLKDFHRHLLQKLYNWKQGAAEWQKPLIARAVQQFYYYMHIYDVQRLRTGGNYTDANCGTRTANAKSTKALECVTTIDWHVSQVEQEFLRSNPGARAGIDTPRKVGIMSGIFYDTGLDTSVVAKMDAHRNKPESRVNFMGLDISNTTGEHWPSYLQNWSYYMREHGYNISRTTIHPGHYETSQTPDGRIRVQWGSLRSALNFPFENPQWARHPLYALGLTPYGTLGYKPTMLVSDRHYNDSKANEGSGWNWDFFIT